MYIFLQPFQLKNQYNRILFLCRYILFFLMIAHCCIVCKYQNLFIFTVGECVSGLVFSNSAHSMNVPWFSIDKRSVFLTMISCFP